MLFGNGGDDVLAGGSGADILVGGAGRDVLSYAGSAAAVQVDLARLTAIGGDAEGDLFDGFEDVEGSVFADALAGDAGARSEEHTSELQSLMRISYAVLCLKKKK